MKQVNSLRAVQVYKKVQGHPDPGVELDHVDEAERDDGPPDDARLFDQRVVKSPAPNQRSRIFGTWVADLETEWGSKSNHPVIANGRDVRLFYKLGNNAVVYYDYDGEIDGKFVGLTKKSGKELNEKNVTAEEQVVFDEAKSVEIGNLERGSAIRFIEDRAEADSIRAELPDRIMPSRFVLTKKQQEVGQKWKAKARWVLLRDPDVMQLERFSPIPATPTVYLTLQVIGSLDFELFVMDVTRAFGQSQPEQRKQGRLFASLPRSGIPGRPAWSLIEVLTAVYGLVNAPASWRTVRTSLGYVESVFDPCLFYLFYQANELELADAPPPKRASFDQRTR